MLREEDPSLPRTDDQWNDAAAKCKLLNKSIHSESLPSGSKCTLEQFILTRAIWKQTEIGKELQQKLLETGLVRKENLTKAKEHLRSLRSWNIYLRSFSNPKHPPGEGTFALVSRFQRLSIKTTEHELDSASKKLTFSPRVTRSMARNKSKENRPTTPTPLASGYEDDLDESMNHLDIDSPSTASISTMSTMSPLSGERAKDYGAIEDEEIVNTSLIMFLDALTLHCSAAKCEWSLYRQPFVVKNRQQHKIYEARVDGLLRTSKTRKVHAIIEVKPFLRNSTPSAFSSIRMQESCQMAAWICQQPDAPVRMKTGNPQYRYVSRPSLQVMTINNKSRRLLISQDGHEIYVTIGSYDSDYVKYITDQALSQADSFLVMRSYGPFLVNHKNHMENLGVLLLAVTLRYS